MTALVVLVPAADPVVERPRLALDAGRSLGVPAHVTVLFPFMPLDQISHSVDADLTALFAAVPAFDASFDAIGWFGSAVVYVRPEPAARFSDLTARIVGRWPDWPPYEGRFDPPVPHLTIGDNGDAVALAAAAREVEAALPISCRVSSVALFRGTDDADSWQHVRDFALGSSGVA